MTELDYHVPPPARRDRDRDPWPLWPRVLRSSPADEEGSDKRFRWAAQEFLDDGDGAVRAIRMVPVAVSRAKDGQRTLVETGDTTDLVCEMVLLALGFDGVETPHCSPTLMSAPIHSAESSVMSGGRPGHPAYSSAATRIAGRRWSCGRLPRDGRPHVPSTCFSQASRRFRLRFIQRHFRCS